MVYRKFMPYLEPLAEISSQTDILTDAVTIR